MENTGNLKLNGYRASHRNKWRFIQCGLLNLQELSLLEFYADLMRYGQDNPNYGLFNVNFNEIAKVFGCRSSNTPRNWHSKLLKIGLIQNTKVKNVCLLSCFTRYITPGYWGGESAKYVDLEKNQPVEVMLQNFGINLQLIGHKAQSVAKKELINLKKSPSIAISSSKVQSSLVLNKSVINQQLKTDEEYQRIYDEGGYKFLMPDDMRWIDENMGEVDAKKPTSRLTI